MTARMAGVEAKDAGLVVRVAYWFTKRKVGKVIEPIKITAHHPRLLRAVGSMEMGQEAARSVPAALKALVQVKVAMMVGCPF